MSLNAYFNINSIELKRLLNINSIELKCLPKHNSIKLKSNTVKLTSIKIEQRSILNGSKKRRIRQGSFRSYSYR